MFKTAIACLALFIPLNLCSVTLIASEDVTTNQTQAISNNEPIVKVNFYNAEEIHASQALMAIKPFEPGQNKVVFELQNYPRNQEIIWEIKRLSGDDPETFQPYKTFTIQDDGSYLTSDQQKLKTLSISSKGFLPGERAIFRFRTNNGSVHKEINGFPNPAIFKDKKGTIGLRAELVHLSPTVYIIDMPTLEEGEQYDIKTVIIGETANAQAKYSRQAPFHFSPSVKGKGKGGDSYFEVQRKSGEIYFLKLPWGTALDSYSNARKIYHAN